MDILVLLEDSPERSPPAEAAPLAHVNSVPPAHPYDGGAREVVTLYGAANAESLAIALAAAVEGQRIGGEHTSAIRHLGVWPERGAVGDAAWRDETTGQVLTQDLDIPFETLRATARGLLGEFGSAIRQMVAGLSMPDWPEGMRRALQFSLATGALLPSYAAPAGATADAWLDSLREADGYEVEGD